VMPIEFGGGQERGLFPGTESVANIVAIGKAAELARMELEETAARLSSMQEKLLEQLKSFKNVKITGALRAADRLPGHISLVVPGAEGEALVMRCDLHGICISSGSACHKGVIEPSHVLKALGLNNEDAQGSVRISLGRFNSEEECEKLIQVLEKVLTGSGTPSVQSQPRC
jgi:cysteine desulfurase